MISKDGESGPSRYFYEENGLDHTKALLSALGDRGKELGLDTLGGGFLSGLFLSGAKSGYNAVKQISSEVERHAKDAGTVLVSSIESRQKNRPLVRPPSWGLPPAGHISMLVLRLRRSRRP